MAFRDTLISNLTTSLSGSNVSVSTELPWNSSGTPLYINNKKKLYIDEDNIAKTELIPVLDNNDVFQTETTVQAFVTVDAKTQPGDMDTIVSTILAGKDGITGQTIKECEVNTEIETDYITYTFDYRFVTV